MGLLVRFGLTMNKVSLLLLFIPLLCWWSCEEPDTTPPSVAITTAFSGTVSEIVTISVMVTDDSGIEKVELWVDGLNTNITDDTEPYVLLWNTASYEDSSDHVLIVRAYDDSGNEADSQPVALTVDNTASAPQGGNITLVAYTLTEMVVVWERSEDGDLKNYKLLYSETESGDKDTIATYTDKTTTSHTMTEFDPTHENWFWVQLTDTLGFSRVGTGMTNEIDSPPNQSEFYDIISENYSFIITWSQNVDNDFHSYSLHESFSEDMSGATLINETDLITDTTYTVTEISAGETRYYQVVTKDIFGLETESEIEIGIGIRPLPTEFPLYENVGWVYTRISYADIDDYNNYIPESQYNDTLYILTDIDEDGYFGFSWDLNYYYSLVKNYDNKLISYGSHFYYNDTTYFYELPSLWASYDEFYDTTEYVNDYVTFPDSRTEVVDTLFGISYETYKNSLESGSDEYVNIEGFVKATNDIYFSRILMIEKLNDTELQNALNIAREQVSHLPNHSSNNFINARHFHGPAFGLNH